MDKLVPQKSNNRRPAQTRKHAPAKKDMPAASKGRVLRGFLVSHASLIRSAVIGVVAVYACFMIVSQVATLQEKKEAKQQLIAVQVSLEQEIEELKDDAEYVGSDEYIEQKAREALGWVKDGEIIFKKAE